MPSQHCRSRFRRRLAGILFLCSFSLCLWWGPLPPSQWQAQWGAVATAQAPNAAQLVQRGVSHYQTGDFRGAIEVWQAALALEQTAADPANAAVIRENLARAYQKLGQFEQAIPYWEAVIAYYRQAGHGQAVGRLLTEQAQAQSRLGQHRQAIELLCGRHSRAEQTCNRGSALQIAREQQDRLGQAAALGSLGNAYRLSAEYLPAIDYLQASLAVADQIGSQDYRASALNSLGNAYLSLAKVAYRRSNSARQRGDGPEAERFQTEAQGRDSEARLNFQNSLRLARAQNQTQSELGALLNLIPIYSRTKPSTLTAEPLRQALKQAPQLLKRLPDSQTKVYAAISLARFLQPVTPLNESFSGTRCLAPEVQPQAAALLNQAITVAQRLQDRRSESFALGELGHLYECREDYNQALNLTQQAQWAANQDLIARDSLYLWQWQAGRIFRKQNKIPDAITAYEQAVASLAGVRGDILGANRDLQFDFRDTVEPVYRELAELKLAQTIRSSAEPETLKQNLNSVLNTMDSLRLAELQNYFGDDCVLTGINEGKLEQINLGPATAVFNTIVLGERTAIVVRLPGGEQKSIWLNVDNAQLRQEIIRLRRGLQTRTSLVSYDPRQAQKVYDWLIRPFIADLARTQVKTLVFIQDGIFRSVPMAALHDGQQFLVQQYAIATTLSLNLTDMQKSTRQGLRALAFGVTQESVIDGQLFSALTNVGTEIEEVEAQLPGSRPVLDNEFTRERLQQELKRSVDPILHIATHGKFSSDPEDTFLVAGQNSKLTINELDRTLRSVGRETSGIDLLTLTACETGVGDDRAILGLAGIAVQTGIKSALASLWLIDDEATVKFVNEFYQHLRDPSLSKAEAVRAAQQALLASREYAHPSYWAPFILIGSWL